MRAAVLLALATTACGLEMRGLGPEPTGEPIADDARAIDASRQRAVPEAGPIDGARTSPSDARASRDGDATSASSDASGGGGDAPWAIDDAGTDASSASANGHADAGGRPDDGSTRDARSADATNALAESGLDAGESDGSSTGDAASTDDAAPCTLPVGWTLAIYNLGLGTCPANFAAHDAYGPPKIDARACSCPCSVTKDGDCMQGTVVVYANQDSVSSCPTPWLSLDVSGGACLSVRQSVGPLVVPARAQASASPAQGGTCSGSSQVDATLVSTPPVQYCDVPAANADAVCQGTVPSGFAACIATSGAVACAPGTPFVHRYVVEDSATLQCSSCGSCTVTTTCTNATIAAYGDRNCLTSAVASIPADGACNSTGGLGAYSSPAQALQYTATSVTTCTEGSSTAAVQLVNPRTICCL